MWIRQKRTKNWRQSLLPTESASEYYPDPDEYEAAEREDPVGVAVSAAELVDADGDYIATVPRGSVFTILLSGVPNTRVQLEDGTTGYIDNDYIYFVPNGPGEGLESTLVTTRSVNVYERATNMIDPLAVLPKNSELTVLGETKSFYKVRCGDVEGFVLKRYTEQKTNLPKEAQEAVEAGSDELTKPIVRVSDDEAVLYNTSAAGKAGAGPLRQRHRSEGDGRDPRATTAWRWTARWATCSSATPTPCWWTSAKGTNPSSSPSKSPRPAVRSRKSRCKAAP